MVEKIISVSSIINSSHIFTNGKEYDKIKVQRKAGKKAKKLAVWRAYV